MIINRITNIPLALFEVDFDITALYLFRFELTRKFLCHNFMCSDEFMLLNRKSGFLTQFELHY